MLISWIYYIGIVHYGLGIDIRPYLVTSLSSLLTDATERRRVNPYGKLSIDLID